MVLRDLIRDVFRTLWSHKLRTFLTMFGIAWGIVSIVLMVRGRRLAERAGRPGQESWQRHHDRVSRAHQPASRWTACRARRALGGRRPPVYTGRIARLRICDPGA